MQVFNLRSEFSVKHTKIFLSRIISSSVIIMRRRPVLKLHVIFPIINVKKTYQFKLIVRTM